jgi:hypothetical protein
MNPYKTPFDVVIDFYPKQVEEIYNTLKTEFDYPNIESLEDKTQLIGRAYATAFAFITEDYIEYVTGYKDWEPYGWFTSQIGLNFINDQVEKTFALYKIDYKKIKDLHWEEDGVPVPYEWDEIEELINELIDKCRKIILANIKTKYKTKENILAFFYQIFELRKNEKIPAKEIECQKAYSSLTLQELLDNKYKPKPDHREDSELANATFNINLPQSAEEFYTHYFTN